MSSWDDLRASVVVCSFNGARTLPATLAALRRQTLHASEFEVLVVDDGSADDTAAVAAREGARVVRLRANSGIAAARNAGAAYARAPIVAYTDDDCRPAPDWLEQLLDPFGDPGVDAAGGRAVPVVEPGVLRGFIEARNPLEVLPARFMSADGLMARLGLYIRNQMVAPSPPGSGELLYAGVTANMAFRRAVLDDLGGFDSAFRVGGEEEELCLRAHARPQGFRLVYRPEAVVEHDFPSDLGDLLRRARGYGRGNARMALKHREVRPIVFPVPVAVVLGLVAALLLRRPRLLAAAVAIPQMALARWPALAAARRKPAALSFPYVQVLQEIATMRGELSEWRTGYVHGTLGIDTYANDESLVDEREADAV